MKRCPRCRAEGPDDSTFCVGCGAALNGLTEHTVPGGPASGALAAEAPLLAPPAGAVRMSSRLRHAAAGTLVDNKYEIVRVLGEGGMGIVYLARDVHTGVEVVLKAVRSELAHRPDVRERTLAEGRAIAHIDHPNVVQLKAVVVEGQSLWLVMQYVDGESLEERIARHVRERTPMPVGEVVRVFLQVLGGTAAAHRAGVIHRDLKPANILIRARDGTAKVSDFGIAKDEDDARAGRGKTKGIIGSLWYMSPEQVTGRRDLDKRVDVYALGIVLYEMLVGSVPFDGENDYEIMKKHAETPIPRVSAMRKDVPAALDRAIQRACAKDREERFASCEEFAAAVERAVTPATHAIASGSGASPAGTPRARWVIPALLGAALLGGGAAFFGRGLLRGRRGGPPSRVSAASTASVAPAASMPAAATTPAQPAPPPREPPRPPLDDMQGRWVSENGRDFEATRIGDALEFRVVKPEQFDPQDYQRGEARFVLRALPGETSLLAMEDRIRPLPPGGKKYDSANARSTCLAVWTSAGDAPLRAVYDGSRFTIDFAKIEPTRQNFVMVGNKVTSCRGLEKLRAAKTPVVIRRP